MNVLAVLQQMWDDTRAGQLAPLTFSPNPNNATAKKLYAITRGHLLSFTNACCTVAGRPDEKMPPLTTKDLLRLQEALASKKWDVVLVCGRPAQSAIEAIWAKAPRAKWPWPLVYMPHPSHRLLTLALREGVQQHLGAVPTHSVEFVQLRGIFDVRPILTPAERRAEAAEIDRSDKAETVALGADPEFRRLVADLNETM